MSKDNYIIPIFVPHLGCPHDCVFCNQREITGITERVTAKDVLKTIDEYLTTIPQDAARIEVAFYGGSFTGIDKNYQIELLSVAGSKLKQGLLTGIRLSTRPDYIDQEKLELLSKYGVSTIELGVQSLIEGVLSKSKRGHKSKDVLNAVLLIKEYGFKLGLQVMPGLPGSTIKSDLETARQVLDLRPDFIRIYPTLVIKGTELANLYQKGLYQPLSLEEAIEVSAKIVTIFQKEGIRVIRIGLQPSEGVNQEGVVAGPFHPAFRQLVDSKLFLDRLETKIGQKKVEKLVIVINSKDTSKLRGQKNKNISILHNKHNIKDIKIKTNDNLKRNQMIVNFEK